MSPPSHMRVGGAERIVVRPPRRKSARAAAVMPAIGRSRGAGPRGRCAEVERSRYGRLARSASSAVTASTAAMTFSNSAT